eukprot:15456996-Alexandrium_andersonii.AAC.1
MEDDNDAEAGAQADDDVPEIQTEGVKKENAVQAAATGAAAGSQEGSAPAKAGGASGGTTPDGDNIGQAVKSALHLSSACPKLVINDLPSARNNQPWL